MSDYTALDAIWTNEIGTANANFGLRFWTDNGSGQPGSEATSMAVDGPSANWTTQYANNALTFKSQADVESSAYQNNQGLGDPVSIKWIELVDLNNTDGSGDPITLGWATQSSAVSIAGGAQIRVKSGTTFEYGDPGSDDLNPAWTPESAQTDYAYPSSSVLKGISDETTNNTTYGADPDGDLYRVTITLKSGTSVTNKAAWGAGGWPTNTTPAQFLDSILASIGVFDFATSEAASDIDMIRIELYNTVSATWDSIYLHDYDVLGATAPTVNPPQTVEITNCDLTV